MRVRALVVIAACAVVGHVAPARAQEQAAAAGAAEALFAEGRNLLEMGKDEAACAKFEESRRLDRVAMGTLFNLAICNERRGRLASAYLQFKEVSAASRNSRQDRYEYSEGRIKELGPKLSTMSLVLANDANIPGLTITLDGVALPAGAIGPRFPIDGGEHKVEASAPAHANSITTVRVANERGNVTVTIPRLNESQQGPTEAAKVEEESTSPIGFYITGAGVLTMAVGGAFGISVLTQASQVKDDSRGFDTQSQKYDSLSWQAWVANITIPVGAIITAVGIYFIASPPSMKRVRPQVGSVRFEF